MTHSQPKTPQYPVRVPPHGSHSTQQHSRWLAAALTLLLAACGGGGGGSPPPPAGGGGGGGGTGGGTTSPTYYLSGPSGVDNGQGLSLSGVNPTTAALVAIPDAALFSTTAAPSGSSELAALTQWTVAGSNASAIGTRLRVWAGTENHLYSTDLGIVAGASAPVTNQVSTLSMASTSVCSSAPTVLRDYAKPANSALVFRTAASCGNPTDTFVAVPMSTGATASPPAASLNEAVDVARDATGAIKQVLWIMHGSSPVQIGVSASVGAAPTSLGTLTGTGLNLNIPSADFASLAVVPQSGGSFVWVYRDASNIMAVNTNAASAPVVVFQKNDADVLSLPVVVDGTNVYLAWTDNQNPVNPTANPLQYTCQLVRIATAGTLAAGSGVIVLNETTLGSGGITTGELPVGISLVGVAGNYLVYFNNGITGGVGTVVLEAVLKTASGLTAPTAAMDQATMPAYFTTTTAPVTVANGVYYNVANGTGSSSQVYFYNLANNPGKAAVGGANGSVLLGGVLANPATAANPTYASALIAELAANASLAGATIIGFDNNGFNGAVLGTLPTLPGGDTYTGATLSEGPLQAGMPALLEVSGLQQSQNGNNATDLFEIIPGTGASLKQVTKNLQ